MRACGKYNRKLPEGSDNPITLFIILIVMFPLVFTCLQYVPLQSKMGALSAIYKVLSKFVTEESQMISV